MVRIYDISRPVYEGMPVYKNRSEKQPRLEIIRDFNDNAQIRESRLHLDAHTGTHLDAPLHVIPGGATVDRLELEGLLGECRVLDFTRVKVCISGQDLADKQIDRGSFVLLKTRNSYHAGFDPSFVYLTSEGASYLAGAGVRGVGIDALGIERDQPEHPTHRILFACGALILEGLDLREIQAGPYYLLVAPLPVLGTEAAPARVFLLPEGMFRVPPDKAR